MQSHHYPRSWREEYSSFCIQMHETSWWRSNISSRITRAIEPNTALKLTYPHILLSTKRQGRHVSFLHVRRSDQVLLGRISTNMNSNFGHDLFIFLLDMYCVRIRIRHIASRESGEEWEFKFPVLSFKFSQFPKVKICKNSSFIIYDLFTHIDPFAAV